MADISKNIIIRNGTVIDGSGAEPFVADVAVTDGRIVEIGADIATGDAETVDAAGLVIAPGFIDIKTHSDWTLPLMPRAESKIRQGVTTEVIGHCGYSCAPALPGKVDVIHDFECGEDVSVEGLSDGFQHCFFVTFDGEKGRAAYLPHAAHQAFVALLKPHLEKVLVIDYWTGK